MRPGLFGVLGLFVFLLVASQTATARASEGGDEETAGAPLQEAAPEDEGKDPGPSSVARALRETDAAQKRADVVGPICETGDFFCQDREVADFKEGDKIALMSAGAYGFTMASNYNTRPMPAEVLVEGDKATLIRRRQTLEDLVALERT